MNTPDHIGDANEMASTSEFMTTETLERLKRAASAKPNGNASNVRAGDLSALIAQAERMTAVGDRMAAMLALAPEAPVTEWPDDDKIMAAVNEWRAL